MKPDKRKKSEASDADATKAAIEAMGLTLEEVMEADAQVSPHRDDWDPRICLCGHAVKRHTDVAGIVRCKPAKMECPCKKVRTVVEAQDTRYFLRRTSGGGPLHALTLGMLSTIKVGKKAEWVVDLVCDRCKSKELPIVPVPVSQHGKALTSSIGYDALLCAKCREEV